jgi:hypothetical protein
MYFLHIFCKNQMKIIGFNNWFSIQDLFGFFSGFFFLKVKSKGQVMPR